jgi:hypothetical protein
MMRNSGAFSLLGMSKSRACTFGAVLLIWLSCSSLLVAAQDGITDPVEGDFNLLELLAALFFSFKDTFHNSTAGLISPSRISTVWHE